MKLYHNMVVKAATELAENRQAWLRTTEEKIVDDNTDGLSLSSPSFDDEENAVRELRTTEGEIVDDSTDSLSLSSIDFDAAYTDAPELLTGGGKFAEDSDMQIKQIEASPLSCLPKEQWQAMNSFLKKDGTGISTNGFKQLFWRSMRGIFNPKLQNTFFQQHVLELLGSELTDGKLMGTAKKDIYSILKTTDEDFRNGMDAMLKKTDGLLRERFGAEATDSYMHSLNRSLQGGSSYYLGCIDSYASSLDDQQYFQLLEAYKEINDPLNKEIYKAAKATLQENSPELTTKLEKLKAVSPYLNNKDCNKTARELVKEIFGALSDQEGLQEAKEEWLRAYYTVIKENMDTAISNKYCKRLSNTLSEVLRLMRPHYTVVQFAKILNKMQFKQIASDKEVCKGIKKSIREHLNCCLTDNNSFSAAIVRQKLERMRDSPSVQDSGELFTFLYQTSEPLRKEVNNYLGNIYEQLKDKMSAAVAAAFIAEYKTDLFKGGEHNPIHNSIAWYAKCLDENLFNTILRENKEHLKGINTIIVKGLWNNIEDTELLPLMQALRTIPPGDAAARQETIKSIRRFIYQKEHGSSGEIVFDGDVERCVQSYKEMFERNADPNTALSFEERLRTYLWQSDPSCSFSFIINHFAHELDTHRYESFLKQQLTSEEVRAYRTHMYRALQRVYRAGGEVKEQMQAVFDNLPVDAAGAVKFNKKAMDEVLRLLSSPEHDMLVMKDVLMGKMFDALAESGINLSLDAKEQKEVFESFFYGDEHNTFFFREILQKVAEEGMPPPATSIFLLRRLLLDIGRAMCGQSNNAQRYAGYGNAEHSFRSKKQFKNVRFPREQEEMHY